jgi:serine protease Do
MKIAAYSHAHYGPKGVVMNEDGRKFPLAAIVLAGLLLFFSALPCPDWALAGSASEQSQLNAKTMGLIGSAVFEVVVPKITHDSLTYEKPLPMDLIPYQIRNDRYYSLGTAFAIGPDQFLTAAHVMWGLSVESQYDEVMLRDREGKVYSIDKITKYSDHRDFVGFSLKGKKAEQYFTPNGRPKLNAKVYAVGNALGEGIVLRDGLYTSNTPEEMDGAWQWVRFSAAASPGNSGGPLLDEEGKVIGIVLGKSENENLNYALPIAEVLNAKPDLAVSYKKVGYVLENMDYTKLATMNFEIPLPATFKELRTELLAKQNRFNEDLLRDLLKENMAEIFPNGDSSNMLLNRITSASFPQLIEKGQDGKWDSFYADSNTSELGNNGYLSYGKLAETFFIKMRKPDNVPLERFYSDSKLFGDLLLKGVSFRREIGSQKIKITSLGKAAEDYMHTDSYGRKWIVRTWNLEYDDDKVVAFLLPVPGGVIGMLKRGQTGLVDNGYVPDMKVLTDFVHLSYRGTFKEWNEFLQSSALLPATFANIKLDLDAGSFRYSSARLSIAHAPDVMAMSEESELRLLFGYLQEKDKVVWDVGGVVVGESKGKDHYYGIFRINRPPKELRDAYKKQWEIVVKREFPFNGTAYYDEGETIIKTVYGASASEPARPDSADFYYTITYQIGGKADQKDMEEHLKKICDSMRVLEPAGQPAKNTAEEAPTARDLKSARK